MDANRFVASPFGEARRTPGRHGFVAYFPSPLPRSLNLESRTIMLLSEADRALGRLAGAGRLLPNPHLLLQPYLTREALASSRIEGTQASLSDVFDAQARSDVEGPVKEVANYIRAFEHGLARLEELPVSRRLMNEVHQILLADVRGQERRPGEVRASQNWIGSPDMRPDTAAFVPPPVVEMEIAFSDLERFMHADLEIPPLIQIALAHYQFETIHPYLDGNGRLGRLMIAFQLVEKQLLPQPLLYLSAYFERRRSDYYDSLQAVREQGKIHEWVDFFLRGVADQAVESIQQAERLADLRERYRSALIGDRSRASDVVDLMFENPVLTTNRIASSLQVTPQSALGLVRKLEALEMVREIERIPGRSKRWVAGDVFAALQPEAPDEI